MFSLGSIVIRTLTPNYCTHSMHSCETIRACGPHVSVLLNGNRNKERGVGDAQF